jgi:hypothetical protein
MRSRDHKPKSIVDVRFARDSLLEGDGFELPVPQQIRSRFRASSPVSHDRVDGLATRNRRFESVSLQRRGINEPHIAIQTYLSTGIRLAFSPGVRDPSKLAMGGEEFIETLPPDLREDVADLP